MDLFSPVSAGNAAEKRLLPKKREEARPLSGETAIEPPRIFLTEPGKNGIIILLSERSDRRCKVSSSVERSLPKPQRRVRFPYLAPDRRPSGRFFAAIGKRGSRFLLPCVYLLIRLMYLSASVFCAVILAYCAVRCTDFAISSAVLRLLLTSALISRMIRLVSRSSL